IRLNRKFKTLHLLTASVPDVSVVPIGRPDVGSKPSDQPVARLVLHYRDGSTVELPVSAVELIGLRGPRGLRVLPQGWELAWLGGNPYLEENQPRVCLHIYRAALQNPKPELEITTIDFISTMTPLAPFIAGMTVQ